MLPAGVVRDVNHADERVFVHRTKDEIKNAPEYDDTLTIDHEYEERIHRHYDEHCETASPYGGAPHEDKRKPGSIFPGEHE